MARRYIASVVPKQDPLRPMCKITPEGEAAWLAMAADTVKE